MRPLFYRYRVHRRPATVHQLERCAGEEKRILLVLVAIVGEILQPHDFVKNHTKIAQQGCMQDPECPAELAIAPLFTAHIVGDERGNFHLVEPLYQFFAVLESGFVEFTVRSAPS